MSLLAAKQDEDVMAEINITPFTDVLLVLLIIFMILAALVIPPGFEKQLANKSNQRQSQSQQKHNIEILVRRDSAILVDGQRTDAAGIYALMQTERTKRGIRHVDLIADTHVPYLIVIRILDAAKVAGYDDIGFVTS